MKKIFSVILLVCTLICGVSPVTTFASNDTLIDDEITIEEFEALEHVYAVYPENRATGLIVDRYFGIAKEGSTLVITGMTACTSEVVKCGFKDIVIERRLNSSSSWSEYSTLGDLLTESTSCNLSKRITVPIGYQYRVTATHYAKKSLFSVQKIDVETGYLTF